MIKFSTVYSILLLLTTYTIQNLAGATVDVTVHLEQASKPSVPTSPSGGTAHKTHPSPSKAPPTAVASGPKVTATPPHGSHSARRNLTRSFEEATMNTPSLKAETGKYSYFNS